MARARTTVSNTWLLGGLVAVASWNVVFARPLPGNDSSWAVGLYMAAEDGLRFGEELIFTYGPLGFLSPLSPSFGGVAITAGGDLSQLAFLYSAAIHFLLCVSLIWALRRHLHFAAAALIVFVAVAGFPAIQRPYVLAAVWCLALLSEQPTPLARRLVIFGGGGLAALESLLRISTGPAILAMCVIALATQETRRRDLGSFAASFIGALAVLWFAAGQTLGNVPDYLSGSIQIVTGYSQAMASAPAGANWDLAALVGGASVIVLAAGAFASTAPRRRQLAAALVSGVAAFAVYKEGVVREDEPHLGILFATALALSLAIPWWRAWRLAGPAVAATLAVLAAVTATPAPEARSFDPIDHADLFGSQLKVLASSERRDQLAESGREVITGLSLLDPEIVRMLRGRSVHVDPSGAAVIWAYGFDWRPLPVFQENSAYTSALDEENVEFLTSPEGPERVLRGVPSAIEPLSSGAGTIDGRNPAWNPPGVAVAMLCRLRPLLTTPLWQLLGPAPDRCGAERPLGTVEADYGERVEVPRGRPGEAVLARIHGAEVSGLERLRALLFRARFRFVEVNDGEARYRLVPGTADDGLIMRVPPRLDFPAPFALSSGVSSLELTGASGELSFEFYALPLAG